MVLRPWRDIVPLMKFLIQRGNALIKNGKCKLVLGRKNVRPINVKTQNAKCVRTISTVVATSIAPTIIGQKLAK